MLTATLIDALIDELAFECQSYMCNIFTKYVPTWRSTPSLPMMNSRQIQRQAYVQAGLPAKTRIVRTESLFRNIAIHGRCMHTLTGMIRPKLLFLLSYSFQLMCKSSNLSLLDTLPTFFSHDELFIFYHDGQHKDFKLMTTACDRALTDTLYHSSSYHSCMVSSLS